MCVLAYACKSVWVHTRVHLCMWRPENNRGLCLFSHSPFSSISEAFFTFLESPKWLRLAASMSVGLMCFYLAITGNMNIRHHIQLFNVDFGD